LRGEADQGQVHRAASHVRHEHDPLLAEADPIAERGRHRLVDEADPAHAQSAQDVLRFRAVHPERRHRRRDDEVAHSLPRRPPDLAQERLGGVAGGEALPPQSHQRPQRPAAQAGLEGGHERRMDRGPVAFERRPPDDGSPADGEPPRQGKPASQAVEPSGLPEKVDGRRHQARRLERILGVAVPGDVRDLDQARLAQRLVPAGDTGVGGS
jgi:hypothetical protein